MFWPFMPNTAEKIFQGFGLDIKEFNFDTIHDITHKAPFSLESIGYLFERLEEEDMQKELEKL